MPAIGGHEFVGHIVEIGEDIDKKETYGIADKEFKVGDRVAVEQIAPAELAGIAVKGSIICVHRTMYMASRII